MIKLSADTIHFRILSQIPVQSGFLQAGGHECNNFGKSCFCSCQKHDSSSTSISSSWMHVSTASLLLLRLVSFSGTLFPLEIFQSQTSATANISEFTLLVKEARRLLGGVVELLSALTSFKLEHLVKKKTESLSVCLRTQTSQKTISMMSKF